MTESRGKASCAGLGGGGLDGDGFGVAVDGGRRESGIDTELSAAPA